VNSGDEAAESTAKTDSVREDRSDVTSTIGDVRRFWDSMPLGVGFVEGELGSVEWFAELDRMKRGFALLGILETFAPAGLAHRRVLDVGCGPGFWARHLVRSGAIYTGIDISARSVGLARRSLELNGLAGGVVNGNAEALPFANDTFDAVVSEGVIHHTPDTQACVDEIWRVLKPGGRAVVSVYLRTAMLRSRPLFALMTAAMRVSGLGLGGRGREAMSAAATPENFVRMYDGADNPIGKAYTRSELHRAFRAFSTVTTTRYFMPPVGPLMGLPPSLRRVISRMFGLMVAVVAYK
jgi:2-polyprenyl-3-methyl-5-hydroxy-6-metoxy-1,4-benzoquinol methylase